MDFTSCPVPKKLGGKSPFLLQEYSYFMVFHLIPNVLTVHSRADRIRSCYQYFLKDSNDFHIQTKQE